MTTPKLSQQRRQLGRTQAEMARLLGCSLIGYKRFESGTRPLPTYIAHSMRAFTFCEERGLWNLLADHLNLSDEDRAAYKKSTSPADPPTP